MEGKNRILGTGSSAVQVIEAAARDAAEVKIFQKEPNWLLPKEARDFSPLERELHKFAPVYWWKRFKLYFDYNNRQFRAQHARSGFKVHQDRAAKSKAFLEKSLADRPDLLKLATPDFPIEARRTVISDTYYDTIKNPKVTLLPQGAKDLTEKGIIDDAGNEHEVDMIVYATGFDAANYLAGFKVKGINGKDLHETWAGEPEALLGLMVPNFPNFFMMYGPNTNAIPLVTYYEAQANFCASLISKAVRKRKQVIEVKEKPFRRFNDRIQQTLSKTVWASTTNYFQAGTGKIVSQWPFTPTEYLISLKIARFTAVRMK
ncbi:flavin-containing monooxygenase [Pseudomonas cavernicola]|uniref:flavin-containing monooxygenase n=1 Tax=Pseudomonas cavernicola TaxID=2320866 RepID=UPI001C49A6F4|nr:hypothetical protein [Pseudomonas cavernicola]